MFTIERSGRSLAYKRKKIDLLLIKEYEVYARIVLERDLVYKVVGGGLDPKTIPLYFDND